MATTIITKYGSGAPTASDVVRGELAVDTENGRLYTETSGGAVIEIGLNPSGNVDVTGTVTADGLTVDGNVSVVSALPRIILEENDATDLNTAIRNNVGVLKVQTVNDAANSFTNRMDIDHSTGDISFYEDTGTTAKFFWDASAESLGIGTSSPTAVLTSVNSGALTLDSNDGDHTGFGLLIEPSTITANTVNSAIGFARSGGRKYAAIGMQTYADADQNGLNFYVQSTASGSSAQLTEAMRIDSSGNLLVGKTAVTLNTEGHAITPTYARFTRDSGNPVQFNRTTNDGDIANFYKDGTLVGSIGSRGSGTSFITLKTSSGSGAGLTGTDNGILPMDESALADNNTDLGSGSYRFKDLYLSGGVYLGGTGAANYLDDYEEGDYDATITTGTSGTVTLNGSFNRLSYTKVGRSVHVSGFLVVSSVSSPVGYFKINLPFTPANLTDRAGDSAVALVIQAVSSANIADFVGSINEADANLYVQLGDSNTIQNDSAEQLQANTYITISATYNAA